MQFRWTFVLVIAASLLLGACAVKPQQAVQLRADALTPGTPQKVGVAMAKLPRPTVQVPGAGCLLCLMTAQAANSTLSRHAETLSGEELATVKGQLAAALRKKGAAATVIPSELDLAQLADAKGTVPGAARKDFAPLRQKYGVDKLVIVQIDQLGFERSYSAYVPTSDPKAVVRGAGYMVDLTKNTYDWYQPFTVVRAADGKWDEPEHFPGLTNAFYQVIELGRDRLLQPFAP